MQALGRQPNEQMPDSRDRKCITAVVNGDGDRQLLGHNVNRAHTLYARSTLRPSDTCSAALA